MTDLLNEAAQIDGMVRMALEKIAGARSRLRTRCAQLDRIHKDAEFIKLCFIEGIADPKMGIHIELPATLVRGYLQGEKDRLEKELDKLIAPFRELTLEAAATNEKR